MFYKLQYNFYYYDFLPNSNVKDTQFIKQFINIFKNKIKTLRLDNPKNYNLKYFK